MKLAKWACSASLLKQPSDQRHQDYQVGKGCVGYVCEVCLAYVFVFGGLLLEHADFIP